MPRIWSEPKQYQSPSGKWVPHAHLYELKGGELSVMPLHFPEGKQFDSEEEARAWSEARAEKWIIDRSV